MLARPLSPHNLRWQYWRMGNGNGEEGNYKAPAVDEGRLADPEDARAREDQDHGDRTET